MPVFTQSRSYIIRIIFAVAFFVIIARLFALQVVSSKYERLAQENAIFKKIVYPPRGIIYDRNGKAIVTNQQMTDLMVIPSEARGVDTAYICQLLEIDTTDFKTRMVNAIVKNGRARPSVFEALLSPEKHARLEENSWRLGNGFYLQERSVRSFPLNAGGHFVGYIGEVDSAIIARSEGFYQSGDYVGRSGMESVYEKVLMGKRGVQYWVKDNRNKLVGRFENGELDEQAVAGRGLRTYVDAGLQQLAEKLLQNKVGSIVAIEPKTGGIIAMTSSPDYNPNQLSGSEKQKNYSRLVLDVSAPLLNRAIKGQYQPGSTYKPLAALIGLDEGVITPRSGIGCTGAYYGCARPVKCTEKWAGHAANLRLAIAHSCNSFFSMTYRVTVDNPALGGVKQGYAKWKEYMNHFGYGVRLGVDLPSEDKGNIPDTSVYNKVYRGSWNSCTNVTLGIGQDMMLVTPLQMANAICIVANKGYYYTPHFVKELENETSEDTLLSQYRVKHEVLTHISDTAYEVVHSGMQDVVEAGTAQVAKIPGINICAKTGTAENKRVIDGKVTKLKDHSVFVAFAPRENPKIAVAVIVENAGFGATWAAPMASLMIEKYLTDSLRADRVKEVERIAAQNLMPVWLKREQYKADSARAVYYFKLTNDSNYLRKFFGRDLPSLKKDTTKPNLSIVKLNASKKETPKPAGPDTQRTGFILLDEQLHTKQRLMQKRRALLS
ncbi:penicillin-binding protein 2 [Flavisolibacter ginsenosidimutans]|uniref:Penicillin-binding protein 2 n=1 Tax=Flavisolibacter ginsenosidimutans TaxID=661481 RepID=A0A5B8ULV8_9BACT|nr:penicillin-binding protein 2 [Flavisolibacter ginsenosidimutans]QEC57563.1 penicillin-binding protein 2 [Flavisolibacter ginsenosidimutans]